MQETVHCPSQTGTVCSNGGYASFIQGQRVYIHYSLQLITVCRLQGHEPLRPPHEQTVGRMSTKWTRHCEHLLLASFVPPVVLCRACRAPSSRAKHMATRGALLLASGLEERMPAPNNACMMPLRGSCCRVFFDHERGAAKRPNLSCKCARCGRRCARVRRPS